MMGRRESVQRMLTAAIEQWAVVCCSNGNEFEPRDFEVEYLKNLSDFPDDPTWEYHNGEVWRTDMDGRRDKKIMWLRPGGFASFNLPPIDYRKKNPNRNAAVTIRN